MTCQYVKIKLAQMNCTFVRILKFYRKSKLKNLKIYLHFSFLFYIFYIFQVILFARGDGSNAALPYGEPKNRAAQNRASPKAGPVFA